MFFRVPEIGEDLKEKNSLLRPDGLPEFNTFTVEKCIAAISKYTIDYENEVKNIENSLDNVQNVFTEVINPLEHLNCPMELTWGLAKTLYMGNSTLMPTKSYMQIHTRAHRANTAKFRSGPINKALRQAKLNTKSLSEEESRILDKYALEGRLNGLELSAVNKEKLESTIFEIRNLRKQYGDKLELATKIFSHTVKDPNVVRDFPDKLLKAMAADVNEPDRGPWKVSLLPHIYQGFMEYCPDKNLRWNAWQGNIGRCSTTVDKSLENSTVLEKIRDYRRQQANCLGFETYADMSMETKMAGTVDNVKHMLSSLLERARPIQNLELESLGNFAKERGFAGNFEHSDIPYWKRKQRKTLYNFDADEIREYFPLPAVLQGLFNLCTKLFDIKIVEKKNVDTWHEDVKFFEIFEADSRSPIAGFYLDPYARECEKIKVQDNSGWMLTIRNRSSITETHPLAALIFNFDVPMYGKPSLLSFSEVQCLFHRFGHSLRHLLTEANYSDVAGISNVEWDVADVCGHVMMHWLYEPSTFKAISSHYTTQEPLSDEIIQNLQQVRTHMAGHDLCKELYLSSLDIQLHSSKAFWRDLVKELWPMYHTLPYDQNDSHPCNFGKIFSGEWGAAYYSSVWSQLIAADVYSAFYEAKHDESAVQEVGRRYRDTYLASGGSCHSNEVFRRFRGRDPSYKALLYSMGLKGKSSDAPKPAE